MKVTLKLENGKEYEVEISGEEFVKDIDVPKQWPEIGHRYFYLGYDGEISAATLQGYTTERYIIKYANCFPTEHAAEMELLRREARGGVRWVPVMGEYYWITGVNGKASQTHWKGDAYDRMRWHFGDCHKTKADQRVWWDKYGKAFEVKR